ncbi:MAG TPA: excinuclease ABC subunit A [Verrucomicrobiae bacterium]
MDAETNAAAEVIAIHGAREHNLKNISLAIPRNQFVVVTGVSGSGKSTLAFDLLFAEGQRRFLDSMNLYARQFVEQLPRPEVDLITGIPPSVSIEQRQSRGGGKSTVATVTEIYHFLRLLLARLGTLHCPKCQLPVQAQTRDEAGRRLMEETRRRGDLLLLAPIVKNRKGFHTEVAEWAANHGYAEVRADGKIYDTSKTLRLDRFREHDVEIVVGVLEKKSGRARPGQKPAHQLIDEALRLGHGTLYALGNDRRVSVHSTERVCPRCGDSFGELDPKMFSYNSPRGWCPGCRGFGELFYLPDAERGARAEAIEESWFEWQEGKREICGDCQGTRLNPIARAVRLPAFGAGPERTIVDISSDSVEAALAWVNRLRLRGREAEIARDIVPEIRERLKFLGKVGLGYLQLGRGATTLSGGEAQRIRLAAQLGSNLSGVLYILDEPTIGLHARDNEQLLAALEALRARGNSLLVVEHDEATMRRADYIIDLGPGAGIHGGEVVACGTLAEIMAHENSATAQCLRERKTHPARGSRRPVPPGGKSLVLSGANRHTLKNLSVSFPLQHFICLTGVSGSGKSTLLRECLLPAAQAQLARKPGPAAGEGAGAVSGAASLRAVYEVDQSPIGRTLRSVPATYVGFFDDIRQLFAQTPEARLRGYTASRFSFNSKQGRCPECLGAGIIKLEMSFMPPALIKCETCQGARFNVETLDVQFHGLNIAQVMDLSVAQALEIFGAFPRVARALAALRDTGLDYLRLGQASPTLSGGEAQRLKLVTHLLTGFRPSDDTRARSCLFLLEEPTIGLHASDVKRLVDVLQRLVDAGHTVVVIEHNLEFIAEADWVIDLGPEGGGQGGRIVAQGTPEAVAKIKSSHTGRFLRKMLQ